MGYRPGTKGFMAFGLHNREIVIYRHDQFHELTFPYYIKHISNTSPQLTCTEDHSEIPSILTPYNTYPISQIINTNPILHRQS